MKGIEALTQKKRSQKRYILHISNPKLRRFFAPAPPPPPRNFGSKNRQKIQLSQLFRNFAAFDNK
ncbi:MAG TPA: hypothetical protein DHV06_14675 [Bacteroides thetaiotaomicron]|nr:hypothetical protein [Bacteroides thetaiotaomicron]